VPRLACTANAAMQCDVSDKTIKRWISEGRLTRYKIGPKTLRIDLDEIEQLAAESKIAG
jgi:excisionase family DNA binding protein